jgi:HD superfamily phosphohydrolase
VKFLKFTSPEIFDDLRNEIRANQRIPKKHTAPITSWGSASAVDGTAVWYYVMPLLPGADLSAFLDALFKAHAPSEQSPAEVVRGLRAVALRVFQEVLLGLEELEYEKLAHMDISPWNIRVLNPLRDAPDLSVLERELKVFLIDLGVARRYGDDPTLALLPLKLNPIFFPIGIVDAITQSVGGTRLVDPKALGKFGSGVDLFMFGRMLDFLFDGESVPTIPGQTDQEARALRHQQWRTVLEEQYDFLREVARRLQDLERKWLLSAADVREVFEALMTPRTGSGYDSTILSDHDIGVRFLVPDALVHVAYPLNRVVDHPLFQRLRNLKQLAFLDQVFPGGTHSRFTHSLQVFDLMKRYVMSLSRDTHFRLAFQRSQVDTLLTAALIHDLGHFPFAHTIEDLRKLGDLCRERLKRDAGEMDEATHRQRLADLEPLHEVRHDHELTSRLLDMEVADWHAGPHRTLKALLEAHGVDVVAACYMFSKTEQAKDARPFERLGRELVTGIIDADRLSYLRLDSRETGVKFGLAVDLDSLVENLRVRPFTEPEEIGLGIEEIAVPAVEAVLAGVYWMYQNVYWHARNRAFMAAVKRCFQRLLCSRTITFEQYWQDTLFESDYSALRYLAQKYEEWLARSSIPSAERFDPLKPLVSGSRLPLEPVWELGQRPSPRRGEGAGGNAGTRSLYDVITNTWAPWLESQLCQQLSQDLYGNTLFAEQIFVDLPLKPRLGGEALAPSSRNGADPGKQETEAELHNRKTQLWVHGRDPVTMAPGKWRRLGERSAFAGLLWSLEDTEVRKIRIFLSRKLHRQITDEGAFRRVIAKSVRRFFSYEQEDQEGP